MNKKELLEKVKELRDRVMPGEPTEEELAAWPANESEFSISHGSKKPIHVYRYAPEAMEAPVPLIIDYHGGGFIRGWSKKSGLFCRRMALTHQCIVWDVDYSLAPEDPFPAAVQEAYRAAEYAFRHAEELGIDPSRILLMGHSAGANLAATVCMRTSETKAFRPVGLIMDYPPLDVFSDPASKPQGEEDSAPADANIYNASYCPNGEGRDPYASPVYANQSLLTEFPNTLILTCQYDKLCKEGEHFAAMLIEAGITVTARRFLNSHHGFTIARTDEWEQSTAQIDQFIRQVF